MFLLLTLNIWLPAGYKKSVKGFLWPAFSRIFQNRRFYSIYENTRKPLLWYVLTILQSLWDQSVSVIVLVGKILKKLQNFCCEFATQKWNALVFKKSKRMCFKKCIYLVLTLGTAVILASCILFPRDGSWKVKNLEIHLDRWKAVLTFEFISLHCFLITCQKNLRNHKQIN